MDQTNTDTEPPKPVAPWMTKKALTPVRMKKSWVMDDDFYLRPPYSQG
jgi:hypothetical protein